MTTEFNMTTENKMENKIENKIETLAESENIKVINILPAAKSDWTLEMMLLKRTPSSYRTLFESIPEEEWQRIAETINKVLNVLAPQINNIWNAFETTPSNEIKVVIVGQDPYFNKHKHLDKPQAVGLSFSVSKSDTVPSSLKNMQKEISQSIGKSISELQLDNKYSAESIKELIELRKAAYGSIAPQNVEFKHGDLSSWARQGILLVNKALTTVIGEKLAHSDLWIEFYARLIDFLNTLPQNIVFVLLGGEAQKGLERISNKHIIIKAAHPSGLSANKGFYGSHVFVRVDAALVKLGGKPINWSLK